MTANLRLSAAAGVAAGLVALILVTAILASAITSAQVAGDLRHATQQLSDIRKADAAAETARVARSRAMNEKLATLQRQNAAQAANEKAQRQALADLRKALRRAGIPVPTPPSVRSGGASPKAPRRTSPATPMPTAPKPRNPSTPDYCVLIPALCIPRLPTALPLP